MQCVGLEGEKFGLWTVVEKVRDPYIYLCKCECGKEGEISAAKLCRGTQYSCGCKRPKVDPLEKKYKTLARVFYGMKSRCYDKNSDAYKYYGGRGITIHQGWLDDIGEFIEWAYDRWEKGLQIDRVNNNGNYTPENCKFISQRENLKNRRAKVSNTGYTYISKVKRKKNTYKLQVKIKGKNVGCFETIEEATAAREKYIKENNIEVILGDLIPLTPQIF